MLKVQRLTEDAFELSRQDMTLMPRHSDGAARIGMQTDPNHAVHECWADEEAAT